MSRWRELIMDFGQIFGTEKSYASSDVFSVESDLNAKRAADVQLRRALEVHFRPLFQRFVYGGEKIACHDLKRLLDDPEYRDRLPAEKIQELEDLVDFNRGKAVTYNEFVRIVLGQQVMDDVVSVDTDSSFDSSKKESRRLRNAMVIVCKNTQPHDVVETKMEWYKCLPPPFFMVAITVIQLIAYIVVASADDVTAEALRGVDVDNPLMYLPTRRREVWRFLSYCFLHQGFVDVLLIVLLQLVLGVPLEVMFGWWRMAAVYVIGVLAGSCCHSMVDHYAGLAGAGGGCYAIIGAHLYALVRHWKLYASYSRDTRRVRYLCSPILRAILISCFVILQVGLAVYRRFALDGVPLKIGFAHYLAGLFIGISIGDTFLTDHRRPPWRGWLLLSVVFSLLILVGCTIVVNIAWSDYPPEDYS